MQDVQSLAVGDNLEHTIRDLGAEASSEVNNASFQEVSTMDGEKIAKKLLAAKLPLVLECAGAIWNLQAWESASDSITIHMYREHKYRSGKFDRYTDRQEAEYVVPKAALKDGNWMGKHVMEKKNRFKAINIKFEMHGMKKNDIWVEMGDNWYMGKF
eukprot:gnl/TRDRNA2_/TRDRNA2_168705_c0_seq3.p1 gnl/TRDRNA2_/TRDRNA2_168705_c0~~gnl/TRDRNA2_/TRDRNA2_168705_c0_seq3.p1  ORF type:complete len:157 (+),score=34.65 gnl/TRDRNA2_/TRDRNA2_168705_c0_seq3:151-621(+)